MSFKASPEEFKPTKGDFFQDKKTHDLYVYDGNEWLLVSVESLQLLPRKDSEK